MLLSAPGRQNEVAGDEQPDRCSGPNRDRRLDVEVALGDLVTRSCRVRLCRFADRLHEIALATDRQLRTDAEQGRDRHALEQRPAMEIDLVGKSRISRRIGRRHVIELD